MSFITYDHDKGIRAWFWVFLEEVSFDFDSIWTGSEVEIYRKDNFCTRSGVVKGCRRWVGPRSLEWVPSTRCIVGEDENVLVQCREGYYGRPHTSAIAGWEDVKVLAQGAEYQHGSAHLEIKRDFRFGASTVRLIVRKMYDYYRVPFFKLSVFIEDIRRDEWNNLLEYQQALMQRNDDIFKDVPCTFRGNEPVIEETPESPWQDNRNDVTNDIRHVALESLPLVLKYVDAQSKAIQRGLSYDDFQWELPNDHEPRVVRRPSAQADTPLRALRLDISIQGPVFVHAPVADFYICSIEVKITAITRSPSLPNNLSSCTFRLDTPYAALANATIPNHSSQIIEISPDSQSADRVITTSGSIHVNGTLQIMGDMFAAPIYGGNVGGQNNTNHFTAPATIETIAHAVLRAMRSETAGEGSFVPLTGRGTNRRRARARYDDEAAVDVEPPRKRRARRSRA